LQQPFPAYRGDGPYVFVSYSHEDASLVYQEVARLHGAGFNIWYDEGIAPGLTWRDELADALARCEVFLFFVTPRSVSSPNCRKEVNFCLARNRKLLSVHLEATHLPAGLELSLSDMQGIIRGDYSAEEYERKLASALRSLLGGTDSNSPVATLPQPRLDRKSIAILPLVNRSSDPDNDHLCNGIAEELIGGLASLRGLKVASPLSSFALKNQGLDVGLIGQKLNVEHVLSGSVQKSGNRVRVRVLLNRVKDGSSLWSARYDRELEDIFEVQEDVARHVVEALKVELGTDQRALLLDAGTANVHAYQAFLIGLHKARRGNLRSLLQAVEHLEQAAQLDPDCARVHWWLYFCYWRLIGVGVPRHEMEPKAEDALERAKALGFVPPVPWIKARRDLFPRSRPDQRTLAREACERIRMPDPEWRCFEFVQLGECLIAAGFDRAACDYYEHYLARVEHDLSATWIERRYRSLLTQLGRFDRAIELWSEFVAVQPDDLYAIGSRANLHALTRQYDKAEVDLAAFRRTSFPWFFYHCCRGEMDIARTLFEQWSFDDPLFLYWGCFLLGDIEEGLDHLEEDVRRGVSPSVFRSNLGEYLPAPTLRSIEQNPRFQAILQQFDIDDAWRDELALMVDRLKDVTGIEVRADDHH
jgi:TolB-like protein